jgi:amino-acid N-acetyltransferase
VNLWVGAATADDLATIDGLLRADQLPTDGLASHLDTCLVGRDGDRIVGAATVEIYGPAGLLRSLVVDAGYRGRGLGRRLAGAAIDLARHHRVRTIYILARPAIDFFPRLGFTRVSQDEVALAVQLSADGRSGSRKDAVVMQLVLG